MRFQKRKCGSFFVKSAKNGPEVSQILTQAFVVMGYFVRWHDDNQADSKDSRRKCGSLFVKNKEEGTRSVPNFDPVRVGALSQNLGQMIDGSHFGTKLDKVYDLPTIA